VGSAIERKDCTSPSSPYMHQGNHAYAQLIKYTTSDTCTHFANPPSVQCVQSSPTIHLYGKTIHRDRGRSRKKKQRFLLFVRLFVFFFFFLLFYFFYLFTFLNHVLLYRCTIRLEYVHVRLLLLHVVIHVASASHPSKYPVLSYDPANLSERLRLFRSI